MVMFNVGASLTLSYVLAVVALATGGIPAGVSA